MMVLTRRNLSTVSNFVRARAHPHKLLRRVPCWALSHQCQSILMCQKETYFFDWPNFACASDPSEYASTSRFCPSVNFSTEWCKTHKPCLNVLPQVSGFLHNLQHYTVERVLCLLQRSRFPQLLRSMLYQEFAGGCPVLPAHSLSTNYPSTVDARAERCSSANQAQSEKSSATGARDKLAGSETLGVRTTEAVFCRLSESSLFLFAR